VADDASPQLPCDVVLLPLEPPAHLPASSAHQIEFLIAWNQINQLKLDAQPAGEARRWEVAYQVGDGPAHGSYVAGAGLRDEVHEPVPLLAVVAAHRRDHGPHPVDRHGIRRGVNQKHEKTLPGQAGDGERRRMADHGGGGGSGGFENPVSPFVFPSLLFQNFWVSRGGC